jgi:hypothetical protein
MQTEAKAEPQDLKCQQKENLYTKCKSLFITDVKG